MNRNTDPGLDAEEAAARLACHEPNRLTPAPVRFWFIAAEEGAELGAAFAAGIRGRVSIHVPCIVSVLMHMMFQSTRRHVCRRDAGALCD